MPKMSQIRLIHWNAKESKEKASRLAAFGYQVNHQLPDPAEMKALKERPPAAIVIDLTRLPSQGRDFGVWLRKQKSTRHIPWYSLVANRRKWIASDSSCPTRNTRRGMK